MLTDHDIQQNLHAALTYIDAHYLQPLDLDHIAATAGYSLSHFYRLFTAMKGFTVRAYIRNRRLAWAAAELKHSGRRILDISMDAGFDSHAVFTRAFQRLYGDSPAGFRVNGDLSQFEDAHAYSQKIYQRIKDSMKPVPIQAQLVEMDEIYLAGKSMKTSIMENIDHHIIPKFWETQFVPLLQQNINLFTEKEKSLSTAHEVLDEDSDMLTHLAALRLQSQRSIPGMECKTIPARKYAVFTPARFLDPLEYSSLAVFAFGKWLPISGLQLDGDFTMDFYIHKKDRDGNPVDSMQVCIPVK